MDFDWSQDQTAIAKRTLEFAQNDLNNGVLERDALHEFGIEEWRRCGRFGLLGVPISTEFGGLGLDCLTTARVFEAFGKGCRDGGLGMSIGAHLFASVMPIAQFASDSLKQRYLPGLVSGEKIGANAITETEAGSDLFSVTTRAEKIGDVYRLFGHKSFVTNGPLADVLVVYASTNSDRGFPGMSAFIVERQWTGITFGSALRKIGLRTSPTCAVNFHDCVVPEGNLLGVEGQGTAIFSTSMNWERTCLFAFWLGTMERQLEEVVERARTRVQFGAPIGTNQAVSHRIVDMKIRLESARLLLYRACWEIDKARVNQMNISMAKVALSEAAVQSSLDGLQLFGGIGVLLETGIERYLRDSVGGTIYSGTSEIHRDIIALHLGLPFRHRRK